MTTPHSPLFFRFHGLTIALHSPDAPILAQWAQLFAGWLESDTAVIRADVHLELAWQDNMSPLPATPALFTNQDSRSDAPAILTVYDGTDGRVHLHFHEAGLVTVPLTAPVYDEPLTARGVVVPASLQNGRFEDVTFTSLAPLLRRYGYYLLHAFAAAKEGRAVLLVGASGSGKTTTGLRLLLDDWELLSNDVVLLQTRPDGVYAYAIPDMVSIRPFTLHLLPALIERLALHPTGRPITLNAYTLTNGRWAEPARATAIYFPQITQLPASAAVPLSRAVCLARLMEQSIDQWDTAVFATHTAVLEKLSQQVAPYVLHLGTDMDTLPTLFVG